MVKHRSNGFTLIEMLIAIAIFATLISVLLMGFNQGLKLWSKGNKRTSEWISFEHRYSWLERVFSQAVASEYQAAQNKGVYVPFFLGNKDKMSFVTTAPIMDATGTLKHIQLKLLSEQGAQTLMYREKQESSKINHNDNFESTKWVPLIKNISQAYFRYEAPKNPFPTSISLHLLPIDMRSRYRNSAEWMAQFDSTKIVSMPSTIEVFFVDDKSRKHQWLFKCQHLPEAWVNEMYDDG